MDDKTLTENLKTVYNNNVSRAHELMCKMAHIACTQLDKVDAVFQQYVTLFNGLIALGRKLGYTVQQVYMHIVNGGVQDE